MLAADTDVLVRSATWDDAVPSPMAKRLFAGGPVFIATTVLPETEWVLRRVYRFPGARPSAALRSLVGLPGAGVENPATMALDLMDAGMDFAGALHLGAGGDCEALISFDRDLAKAARLGTLPVRAPGS